MNDRQDRTELHKKLSPLGTKSKAGGIAIALVLVAYSFAAPQLNGRFGWNLPQIRTDSSRNNNFDKPSRKGSDSDSTSLVDAKSPGDSDGNGHERSRTDSKSPKTDSPIIPQDAEKKSESRHDPRADRSEPSETNSPRGPPTPGAEDRNPDEADDDLRYGLLREVSPDRFISPAGLLYTPGSAEGHRLEHLRRHIKNDPRRSGSHGVFDGEMEGALATIDQAYLRAKKNQKTTKKTDRDRTIYTVDMGKRIGYVGGREGDRRRNPMARRVRLVLEGNRVITAYPL